MSLRLREIIEQSCREAIIPKIAGERCVHALFTDASCRVCIDSCPQGAWSLDENALNLDTAACDGCGLCVATCPEEALAIPLELVIRGELGQPYALFSCEQALPFGSGEGVLPCLHAIGLQRLLSLHAKGIRQLQVASGDCNSCDRGRGGHLNDLVENLDRSLRSANCPGIGLRNLSVDEFRRLRDGPAGFPSGVDVTRRGFLKGLTRSGLRQMEELSLASGLAEGRSAPPGRSLPDLPGTTLWPWQPLIDGDRCNGCDACVRLCPHQAIVLEQTELGAGYRLEPGNCTGCSLCQDICDQEAIELPRWRPQWQRVIALQQERCTACGAEFHTPREQPLPASGKCRICSQKNHYRNLYQVLE